jgi:hypothetical protein
MANKCTHGKEEKWKLASVHRFHGPEQVIPQRQFPVIKNQQGCGFSNRLRDDGSTGLFFSLPLFLAA